MTPTRQAEVFVVVAVLAAAVAFVWLGNPELAATLVGGALGYVTPRVPSPPSR